MSLENPKGIESSVSKNTVQRRTFLKRASAGAALASIPGRSAWATVNGSVVASGQGSDFSQDVEIKLLSHGIWKQRTHPTLNNGNRGTHRADNVAFNSVFTLSTISDTFHEVLNGSQQNVHFQMVAMYLNAKYHGTLGLVYPIVKNALYPETSGAPFDSYSEYAAELWSMYLSNPNLGSELDGLIVSNHV